MFDDVAVKRERIRLWIEALRSESYRQGQHALRRLTYPHLISDEDEFCCLGIGCEVAKDNGLPLTIQIRDASAYYTRSRGDFSAISFPDAVRDWYGLESDDPIIGFDDVRGPIRALDANDSLNLSFSQIADLLERTYLGEEDHGTE